MTWTRIFPRLTLSGANNCMELRTPLIRHNDGVILRPCARNDWVAWAWAECNGVTHPRAATPLRGRFQVVNGNAPAFAGRHYPVGAVGLPGLHTPTVGSEPSA